MDNDYWNHLANRYDCRSKKYYKMYDRLINLLKLELLPTDKVLDIGTGTGEIPIILRDSAEEFHGIDMSESMIDIAKNKIAVAKISNVFFSVQDSYNLEIKDNTYNMVIIANLLHIVDNPEKVIHEANRVLKEEGKLIIATYLHGHSFQTRIMSFFLQLKGHPIYTRFNGNSMADLLRVSGFEIIKQVRIDNLIPVSFIVTQKTKLR